MNSAYRNNSDSCMKQNRDISITKNPTIMETDRKTLNPFIWCGFKSELLLANRICPRKIPANPIRAVEEIKMPVTNSIGNSTTIIISSGKEPKNVRRKS